MDCRRFCFAAYETFLFLRGGFVFRAAESSSVSRFIAVVRFAFCVLLACEVTCKTPWLVMREESLLRILCFCRSVKVGLLAMSSETVTRVFSLLTF